MKEKYSKELGVRYSRFQKSRFIEALTKDVETFGYEVQIDKQRANLGTCRNIIVGNIKNAKHLILVPYDTPSKVFWKNYKYYPQEGQLCTKQYFMPMFIPMVFSYAVLLFLLYVLPLFLSEQMKFIVYLLSVAYLACIFVLIMRGYANRHNCVRNTSSIHLALDLMNEMPKKTRKECAFVFMDQTSMKGYGGQNLSKYLESIHKNPKKIAFNCIGRREVLRIAYMKGMRKEACELESCGQGIYPVHTKAMDKEDTNYSMLDTLNDAICISSGTLEDTHLYVKQTACNADCTIDESLYAQVKTMLLTYLK